VPPGESQPIFCPPVWNPGKKVYSSGRAVSPKPPPTPGPTRRPGPANDLPEEAWMGLERLPRYEIATGPRCKPGKVKEEIVLFDEVRYFFYITNRRSDTAEKIVGLATGSCNQENVIEQLKNSVNAMPVNDLLSNWAYMVMTALAWDLKAWFALQLPAAKRGEKILRMEFLRFMHSLILIPAQIVRAGRRIIYRLLSYNSWVPDLFRAREALRRW
jgi:hypothetical protein